MDGLEREARAAIRQLIRHRGFLLAAVAILALGIGLGSLVFSVVNGLLLRPLPVYVPDELVSIYGATPDAFMATSALATDDVLDLAESVRGLASLIAYTYAPMTVEDGDAHRLVLGVRATPEYFSTLGVKAALGRTFSADEDLESAVAVLADAAWRRRFGADPGIVGALFA